MKKRLLAVLLVSGMLLSGCGNKQILDTKYTFKQATIVIGTKNIDVKIKKWKDYDDGSVQIIADDGKVYLTHSSNVLLIGE